MRVWIIALGLVSAVAARAGEKPKIMDDGIDMQQTHLYNNAFLDLSSTSNDFTDAVIAHHGISVGQLVGINPETGEIVTNAVNLLPIMVRSAYVAGTVNAGGYVGDGSGLTNLNAGSIVGYLPVSVMPTSGVWNVSGLTLKNANFEGPVSVGGQALDVSSDLNVQGRLSGDASGLSNLPAGGTDGSLQFNSNGQLAGNSNYFIHAETGKLAFQAKEGNLWRAYKRGVVAPENLAYVVRDYKRTVELCLLTDGVEKIRLRGDGSAYIAGSLEVKGDVTFANGMTVGGNNWYIPESGDLPMGNHVAGAGLSAAAGQYVPDATDLSMGGYTQP